MTRTSELLALTDLVIVSMHEKGFPQADFYKDCGEMPADEFNWLGLSPDDFFTLAHGADLASAIRYARERWPTARIVESDEDEDDESGAALAHEEQK